jgi:hypothetical protein
MKRPESARAITFLLFTMYDCLACVCVFLVRGSLKCSRPSAKPPTHPSLHPRKEGEKKQSTRAERCGSSKRGFFLLIMADSLSRLIEEGLKKDPLPPLPHLYASGGRDDPGAHVSEALYSSTFPKLATNLSAGLLFICSQGLAFSPYSIFQRPPVRPHGAQVLTN